MNIKKKKENCRVDNLSYRSSHIKQTQDDVFTLQLKMICKIKFFNYAEVIPCH